MEKTGGRQVKKPRTHTPEFLKKQMEKRKTEMDADEHRRIALEKRKAETAATLDELRQLGWTEFMKKNGKKVGKRLVARIKRAFPEEYAKCYWPNRRSTSLLQS